MAGTERFHRRFLGGEAAGEVGDRIPPARTISNLPLGEHAAEKTVTVSLVHVSDPRDVGRIEAQSKNVHD